MGCSSNIILQLSVERDTQAVETVVATWRLMPPLLGSLFETRALWAQPTAGFTSQFMTDEVAQELVSLERSSHLPTCAGGRPARGQWTRRGWVETSSGVAPALTAHGPVPEREEGRAHYASGSDWEIGRAHV